MSGEKQRWLFWMSFFRPCFAAVAIEEAGEQSRSTHGHVEAIDACRYMCSIMLGALAGWPKEKILSKYFSPVCEPLLLSFDFHSIYASLVLFG